MKTSPNDTAKCGTNSTGCKRLALPFLVALLLLASGCQDHHWVPYEKMGPLPDPEVKIRGVIISGRVELAPETAGRDFSGWTLYIIARSAEGSSMLAAVKAQKVTFPYRFKITDKNVMLGEAAEGMSYSVEARFDADGKPETKDSEDLIGKAKDAFPLGADNAVIVLAPQAG